MDTGSSYISKLEKGLTNLSLEMMIRYAGFFGVKHYELSNPRLPAPTFDQLPATTRKAITKVRAQQQKEKNNLEKTKAVNKADGVPGRAKQLHSLVASGYFKRFRTAKDIFIKLNPGVSKKELNTFAEEIGKITTTLSQGKFPRLLDKLEPAPGTTAVRFVIKDPNIINYLDGPVGTKDMAADEGG